MDKYTVIIKGTDTEYEIECDRYALEFNHDIANQTLTFYTGNKVEALFLLSSICRLL